MAYGKMFLFPSKNFYPEHKALFFNDKKSDITDGIMLLCRNARKYGTIKCFDIEAFKCNFPPF